MAYSNWGAFVYKNGERRRNKEDVGVFDTDEGDLPSGSRIFANILKNNATSRETPAWKHSRHAVLGDGPVRLCGYKNYPELWIIKNDIVESVALPDFEVYENDEKSGDIDLDDKTYKWSFDQGDNTIDLRLEESDGTIWTSKCGYGIGAGFEED